ncbi:Elongin-A [Psilocybe cubensis]|uniref:Elongin-A n=2 Tax=Psilocybe cubensis TaxID=181762 RepID=A0ACB8H9Q6_PSICU|nr:Elongin-A [Psilocybe cubensis]KAH9483890.1 Elongin-A [Psilocybe cubensis]
MSRFGCVAITAGQLIVIHAVAGVHRTTTSLFSVYITFLSSLVMDSESDLPLRRVPTLVSLCQRAAIGQGVESIFTLGSDLTYSLVKPILEKCNAEQLSRFEHLSPHLQKDTPELWKARCFSDYPLPAERYIDDDPEEPETWRSRFLELRESESKRMDELASKLRTQRMEADERKKEKEVKYTDRVPSAKRPRYGSTQPKTLFQKTKSDASKVQRAYYNTRVIPPMPASKKHRVLPQNPGATLSPVPSSSSGSRVVVNTVIRRPLVSTSSSAASGSLVGRARVSTLKAPSSHPFPSDAPNSPSISERPDAHSSNSSLPHTVVDPPRPMAKLPTPKKDPMASLFVPKRKPPPQRSV